MIIKEWTNKWNPFNSIKLLAHVYRWSEIKKNNSIPQPVTVTIDPINTCNLRCTWCNSEYILNHNDKKIEDDTLLEIVSFLSEWKVHPFTEKGVETICIAGGGEPTLHPNLSNFIQKCYDVGIQTGIVTNGTNIDKHLNSLLNCTWVGISIDAGTPETFKKLKGKDLFDKIIQNVKILSELTSEMKHAPLSQPGQGPGISYKFLLHPKNIGDLYTAAKLAKSIGCKNLHIRPFGESWDKIGQLKDVFSYSDIVEFKENLNKARELEDKKFKIFGITHKFDGNFKKEIFFKICRAIFMTCVFMPSKDEGKFDFGLCCDRRGDEKITFHNLNSPKEVLDIWGSEKHWSISDEIRTNECPRCTYQPHNKLF